MMLFMWEFFSVKKLTKMSEKVALGVLSGAVKVSGFLTGSVVNSKPGKKFFSFLPGEVLLASLDGFSKLLVNFDLISAYLFVLHLMLSIGLFLFLIIWIFVYDLQIGCVML